MAARKGITVYVLTITLGETRQVDTTNPHHKGPTWGQQQRVNDVVVAFYIGIALQPENIKKGDSCKTILIPVP